MRILFCADTFPGRFGPLASACVAAGHEVIFASHYGRRDFSLPGVRRVLLKPARRRSLPESPEEAARQELSRALTTARYAAEAFSLLQKNGFEPELVVFSSTSGAALSLSRAFPQAVLVGCAEGLSFRSSREEAEAARLRLRACAAQAHACFAFSQERLDELPPLLRRHARLLPPAVDTDFFSPQAAAPFEGSASGELVSVDLRSLPAASSRALWNICAGLLARRPQCRVLMNCADAAVMEKADSMAQILPPEWRERLCIRDFANLHEWRDMLASSTLHIFPEAACGRSAMPEVLEAMSCGAVLAAPEAAVKLVEGFLGDILEKNGSCRAEAEGALLRIPATNVEEQFTAVNSLLDSPKRLNTLKIRARSLIVRTCAQEDAAPRQLESVLELFRSCEL